MNIHTVSDFLLPTVAHFASDPDPLLLCWEDVLRKHLCDALRRTGWKLVLPAQGGHGRRSLELSFADGRHRVVEGDSIARDSTDVVAYDPGDGDTVEIELKSFPAIGPKAGRSGMETGLRKDLRNVARGRSLLFVADSASYRAMRGERLGARGPKVSWRLDLPPIDELAGWGDFRLDWGAAALFRVAPEGTRVDRVVGLLYRPEHAGIYRGREAA